MELINKKETKYLIFIKYSSGHKKTYDIVIHNKNEEKVGNIWFKNTWRTYIFEPMDDMIFDTKCLKDIYDYIELLNKERKSK
jgi:hypothetical protein